MRSGDMCWFHMAILVRNLSALLAAPGINMLSIQTYSHPIAYTNLKYANHHLNSYSNRVLISLIN